MIREWAAAYRESGIEGFHLKKGNSSYTAEEKQQQENAPYYDLQGRPVTDPEHGIYINGGKKVFVR